MWVASQHYRMSNSVPPFVKVTLTQNSSTPKKSIFTTSVSFTVSSCYRISWGIWRMKIWNSYGVILSLKTADFLNWYTVKIKWWTWPPSSDICGNCRWPSPTIATNIPTWWWRSPFSFYSVGHKLLNLRTDKNFWISRVTSFVLFPTAGFCFTYKPDAGVVNNDVSQSHSMNPVWLILPQSFKYSGIS